jgi:hypothetical protein
LQRNETYSFRPTKIDGINVYIVIYDKFKVVNIESIFVQCKVNINSLEEIQNYSLYHFEYKSLEKAIDKIEKIKIEYKLYNGELVEPLVYNLLKLEECILPFSEDEKCCVCFENTSDITLCNHSICLLCRETSLLNNHFDCPICRNSCALHFYNNRNNLINNQQFSIIKKAIHYEKIALPSNRDYHIESTPTNNENLEIIEWIISRTPTTIITQSNQLEDGEIIEELQENRIEIDLTYQSDEEQDSILTPPLSIADIQTV